MKYAIKAGSEFETCTPDEVRNLLQTGQQSWFAELARGFKPMRFSVSGTGDPLNFPLPDQGPIGPRPGFVWAIQRITAFGLNGSDAMRIHRNNRDGSGYLGKCTGTVDAIFPGETGMILLPGETLLMTGTGLTGQISVNGEALELPSAQIWKLL